MGGMRAFASFQVLLLHYLGAFLPAAAGVSIVAHYRWEKSFIHSPLFFLADGYFAVGLFFLMSGFVLAPSFIRSDLGLTRNVAKRVLRLGVPVLAAVVFAMALLMAMPEAKHQAAALSQSTWLDTLYLAPLRFVDGLKHAVVSVVAGNQGISVFPPGSMIARWLKAPPLAFSVDPPVWTLHWELWGSLLVLGMAQVYRRVPRPVFWVVFAGVFALCGTSFLSLFLVGFALYLARNAILRRSVAGTALGLGLMAAGIAVVLVPTPQGIPAYLNGLPGLHILDAYQFQSELGAVLVFAGVLLNCHVRDWLSTRPMVALGRISFSLYLIHFPVLVTVAALVFRQVLPYGYLQAAVAALFAGTACTLVIAIAFERLADRPALELSRMVGGLFRTPAASSRRRAVLSPRVIGPAVVLGVALLEVVGGFTFFAVRPSMATHTDSRSVLASAAHQPDGPGAVTAATAATAAKTKAVIIGDSHGWLWTLYAPDLPNLSRAGEPTDGVASTIPAALALHPRYVVVFSGSIDLTIGQSWQGLAATLRDMVAKIKAGGATPILCEVPTYTRTMNTAPWIGLGLFPKSVGSVVVLKGADQVASLNAAMHQMGVPVVDVPPGHSIDGMHLSSDGYKILNQELQAITG